MSGSQIEQGYLTVCLKPRTRRFCQPSKAPLQKQLHGRSVSEMLCAAGCTWLRGGNGALFIVSVSVRTLFIHLALTVKTKWTTMTLAGPCSTVLLQFSTKNSESLWQDVYKQQGSSGNLQMLPQYCFIRDALLQGSYLQNTKSWTVFIGGLDKSYSLQHCVLSCLRTWHLVSLVKSSTCLSGRRDISCYHLLLLNSQQGKQMLWKIHSDKRPMPPAPVTEAHGTHVAAQSIPSALTQAVLGPALSSSQQAAPPAPDVLQSAKIHRLQPAVTLRRSWWKLHCSHDQVLLRTDWTSPPSCHWKAQCPFFTLIPQKELSLPSTTDATKRSLCTLACLNILCTTLLVRSGREQTWRQGPAEAHCKHCVNAPG